MTKEEKTARMERRRKERREGGCKGVKKGMMALKRDILRRDERIHGRRVEAIEKVKQTEAGKRKESGREDEMEGERKKEGMEHGSEGGW